MKRGEYSLKQWCLDNDKQWILDTWCEELNGCLPEEVTYRANKKFYFHCGNPEHKPEYIRIANLTQVKCKLDDLNFCTGCNSLGEFIKNSDLDIDLDQIWSDKNDFSPYEVRRGSGKHVMIRCVNNESHPDYESQARYVGYGYGCPYCSGRGLCKENSLGFLYPEVIPLWSDLNNKTPFDYTYGSSKKAYFKCDSGIHEDYERKIEDSTRRNFKCPICAYNNKIMPTGENHPNWRFDRSDLEHARSSGEYNRWRINVFIRDDRTCQCCGSKKTINAHHIYSFANHKELWFEIGNGITLCSECHDSTIKGSLHNIYGTRDVSPETLEKYINDKRRMLGIPDNFSIEDYIGKIELIAS